MYQPILRAHLKKRSGKDLLNDVYAMFLCFSDFIKVYVVGTHLNCINKLMQFKWVPSTPLLYKEVDKKYTFCNLKTSELLDCAYRGMHGN